MIDMIKMNFITVIILGCAAWRLTSLFCNEVGPFEIFKKIRRKIGISHYDNGLPFEYPDTFFGQLFSCMWCLSVWIAGALVLTYIFLPNFAIYFSLWLTLSTITILIDRVT